MLTTTPQEKPTAAANARGLASPATQPDSASQGAFVPTAASLATPSTSQLTGLTMTTQSSPLQSTTNATSTSTTKATKATKATTKDLKSLRLPASYGATLGVKKLLTTVPVGKPRKPQFFRTHAAPEMTFAAMLLEQKDSRESYLVGPDVAQVFSELVRPVQLHAAIDRQNNVFLIPVPLPGETGTRNPWHESLAQAVEYAKLKWLRLSPNQYAGSYDVYEAEGALPEPEWPEHDIDALVEVAFRSKIITTLDHPVVQSLLGKI